MKKLFDQWAAYGIKRFTERNKKKGLTIYWTNFSEKELQNIFSYYQEKASIKIATEITERIVNEIDILENNPYITQIEEFLTERTKEFRYLLYDNYKIVY